jgi:hypothetical protein
VWGVLLFQFWSSVFVVAVYPGCRRHYWIVVSFDPLIAMQLSPGIVLRFLLVGNQLLL